MNPIVATVATALERAAALIEKGAAPAKALRQVAQELGDYADRHAQQPIPSRLFTHALGEKRVTA